MENRAECAGNTLHEPLLEDNGGLLAFGQQVAAVLQSLWGRGFEKLGTSEVGEGAEGKSHFCYKFIITNPDFRDVVLVSMLAFQDLDLLY